ncbi:MAG TPA: CsgG/HfaB family protein [Bacteroidales bacterium]|nr:CsgG/HfaB family protein [Bacteroidales bacterium]
MKKRLLILSYIFSILTSISGKNNQITVGILPTTDERGMTNSTTTIISESIINCFSKTKRFQLVDRSKMEAINAEKDLQKTENFIDGTTIKQGNSVGAQYLVTSSVSSFTSDKKDCSFLLNLKVINVETGQIRAAEDYSIKGMAIIAKTGSIVSGTTMLAPIRGLGNIAGTNQAIGAIQSGNEDAAFKKALENMVEKVDEFVNKNFVPVYTLVKILKKDSGGNAQQVLLLEGFDAGLKKGDRLKVDEITQLEVNGKSYTRKNTIAQLIIRNVEGENFSACEITSGSKELTEKIEQNAIIQVSPLRKD